MLCLIIVGLVTFIIADKVINNKEENNISESQANNQALQKEDNNSENEINNNSNFTSSESSNTIPNQSTTTLSTQEALSLGNEMYKKANECYWEVVGENHLVYDIDESGNPYYKITNIDEIKSVLINKAFSDFCREKGIKEKNGEYYIVDAGRGSDLSYLDNELNIDSITENKIVFTSIEKYCANEEDFGIYSDVSEVKDITTKEYKFVIVQEGENWKVCEFTLPN